MRVRSLTESTDRYVRNSIRAYLDGEQGLAWVVGVICHSGADLRRCRALFASVAFLGDGSRRASLEAWFVEQESTAPVSA